MLHTKDPSFSEVKLRLDQLLRGEGDNRRGDW